MGFELRRYRPEDQPAWDALVHAARNGVFLFERRYLDYHHDRFDDASLLVHREGRLCALLPAHRVVAADGPWLVSHGGLTFGGLVLHPDLGAADVLALVEELASWLGAQGWRRLVYRPVPHIFHRLPSEDDVYALHRLGARLVRVDLASTVDLERRPPLASGRRHALKKAERAGVRVGLSRDFAAFWRLLEGVLAQRHGTQPTHRLAEIEQLAARCDEIHLHAAWRNDGEAPAHLLAGLVTYRFDGVLHTQYMAASDEGRQFGALDAIVGALLQAPPAGARWLSFGASSHDQGRQLNAGLAAQKEMFGARSTVLTTFELDLTQEQM